MLPIHTEKLTLSDQARRFLPPAAPPPARMMAAKGLAPLTPVELITVQVVLTADTESTIAEAARASIVSQPENMLKAAAQGTADPAILDYLSYCSLPAGVKEAIVLNKHVADETLVHIAKDETDGAILDILAGNQARMLQHPDIAEQLIENPKLGFATKKRLEEFFINDFAAKVLSEEAPAAAAGPAGSASPALDPTLTAELASALAGLPAGESELSAEELAKEFLEEKPEEASTPAAPSPEEEEKKGGQYAQIMKMKVSHKIKLALKGNKEARGILVKDSNKLVCGAVLKNPRITEGEVQSIANSKSAIEDLLRGIAANSQWMRNYQIKVALLNNPKTPFPISQKILPSMLDKDVHNLTKSKGIPGALKQAAERLVRARQKK